MFVGYFFTEDASYVPQCGKILNEFARFDFCSAKLLFQKVFFKIFHKVQIFWEGHKILQNLQCRFEFYYIGLIYGGDFAKICGLLRIYDLYSKKSECTEVIR